MFNLLFVCFVDFKYSCCKSSWCWGLPWLLWGDV